MDRFKDTKKESMLTDSQFGIYLECIDENNCADYLLPISFVFQKGKIDAVKLSDAFDKVANTYSAFSTVIKTVNSEPIMTIYDKELPKLKVRKISENDVKTRKMELFKPFSFNGELLWRGEILETENDIIFLLIIHHNIFDGTSMAVLNNALALAYEGKDLSEEGTVFDAKKAEDDMVDNGISKESMDFYDEYLDGIETDSNIIPDMPQVNTSKMAVVDVACEIPMDKITAFAKENSVTENIVFLSAFAYTLCKVNGQKDALFSSVESGRFGGGYNNSIGMFVKSFPIRINYDEEIASFDFVKGVKTNFFNTLSHNHIKFSDLIQNYSGIADVRYIYQGEMFKGIAVGGVAPRIDVLDTYEPVSNFDFMVYKIDNTFRIWLGYKCTMYTRELIEHFADMFFCVLNGMLDGKKLGDISFVSQKGMEELDKINNTKFTYDEGLTVNSIFEEATEKYPNNIAVLYKDKKLTYSELNTQINKVATYVSQKGIGKNEFVSVLIPRNEFMPITAMGIIKAGAGYQPLDPTYPKDRLDFMVSDSKSKLLIADRSLIGLLSEYKGDILYTDEIDNISEMPFKTDVKPDNAFVLIYTSGTTGTPKGCIIENKNIVALYFNHKKLVELSPNSKVATIASFGFDAAVMDIFTTLMVGATLYIIPDEIKLDIPEVEKIYIENGITNGFMTTQLGRMFLEQTKCKTLKHFVLGGEKLVPFTPPAWVQCHNCYGPSETIAYVTGYTIKDDSSMQPIGKLSINTKAYIVDSTNRLLPIGACGELCIAGLQVGRGYFERPEKTAEVFVKNPFSNECGYDRIYKTGDVVRLLPDGNLDFIGRRDGQVKIRGFRIELTEVEQVIRSFDGIKNATVQTYDDAVSGKFIAAFIVADSKIDIDKLNKYIMSQKPAYMVPAVTMQIDNIPVNANAKVDKKKLPKPEYSFGEIVAPQNNTQQDIFDIVTSVIGTTAISIDTDLYLAGLSSIGSIKLCSLLAEKFNITIQMKDLKQNNTIVKLETFVDTAGQNAEFERTILDDYPLTKTQEGIFVECISKPESTVYNIPILLKLSDKLDINKLKSAIVSAVSAHPYIKTELFTDENGTVRQKKMDDAHFDVDSIDNINEEIDSIKETLIQPFELLNSRLFRVKIIKDSYLFLEFHHIILDGTSINLFLRDIEKAYCGEELQEERYNSFDLSYNEEQKRKTSALDEAKKHYDNILDGLDMNFLPEPDRLMSAKKDSGSLLMSQMLPSVDKVLEYCNKNNIGINGFLSGVFGFVLAKYAGTEYSVFNTIYNGRNDSRAMTTIGMLVKTIPVVCNIEKENSADIAKAVSSQIIDSMTNDLYSFAEICNEYGVRNDIVFVYQGDDFEFNTFCGETVSEVHLELSESKAPIAFEVSIVNGKFNYKVDYNAEIFTEKLIQTLVCAFDKAIYSFVNGEKVSEISLLTDEITKELDKYNETEFVYDTSKTIIDHYIEQVKLNPDRKCVVYKDKTYTYKEANDLSRKVSSHLISSGINKGDIVAILINRDENMILASYGVIMSGCAYVGLDPTYPKDRLDLMITDSGAKALIADRSLMGLISKPDCKIIYTDEFEALPTNDDVVDQRISEITPNDRCLVIYSSGTTGVPKGAVLCHKNVVSFYYNYTNDMDIKVGSCVATYASFGFDGGAQDVFCCPMSGASLYVIPDDIRLDMDKLEQFYIQNKITSGFMTTQVGAMFVNNTKCRTLRNFLVGGEKLIPAIPPAWTNFMNGYGPSETMCYVNKYHVADTGNLQPIGKTSKNVKEYIIDKYGNRLPFGACGELCISGGQTGMGYLNRPEKTAQSFVKNPFCNLEPYDRMYKTGDIARIMPDGNYVFVGRRDGQVKIRGFRVELSEIEQQIRKFDGITNATVEAFDSSTGGKFLAAYIVANKEIDIAKLNEFIASEKPDYMVPAVTMRLDEIPLTSNGKVDKKKLPKPTPTTRKGIEPANETEETICDIFEEVLGLEKVYADDDFFAIGGSSISAIQVVVKCNNAGYSIVFKNLFSNPTPHGLCEFIHGGRDTKVFAPDDKEADKYDYSALKYNTVDYVNEITSGEIGDVLLTGVTGFLGSHILKELIENTSGNVICLVRAKGDMSGETRFQMMMTYYFEDWFTDEMKKRVTVIEGELGDEGILEKVKDCHFDTIINSAANVKHFAAGDELLKDNFTGVGNMVALAEEKNALFVQISSTSVSGEAVEGGVSDDFLFRECDLNIGQSLENKYIFSKYQAEQLVIDAISKGKIRGKVIRLGNLMARENDSEFQINAGSNGFLKQFSGYKKLAMFPVDLMDKHIEFSPIDSTAKAIVLLSGTPDKFTVFHAKNCNSIHYGYFINAMISKGININIVPNEVFTKRYKQALNEETDISDFTSFIAYMSNANSDKVMHQIESSADFTTKALYRLGFAWPLISSKYLEEMVKTLIDLSFFS